MRLRTVIAALLFFIGFIFIAGAVGQSEFSIISAREFWIRVSGGLTLMIISYPISGDYKEE